MLNIYTQDTFFQLSWTGRFGLTILSLCAGVALTYLVLAISRRLPGVGRRLTGALRLGISVIVFWLFLWISPQVYYLFYQAIIDYLPWQMVIGAPPSLYDVGRILLLLETHTLAHHAQALLGWALILTALFGNDRKVDV